MKALMQKILNMVTHVNVVQTYDDQELYPKVQVKYLRKDTDVTRLLPYPVIGNVPARGLGVKLNIQGSEGNRVAIMHDPKNRLKGLKEGEGGIHNSLTGSYVLLLENGNISVVSKQDLLEEVTGNLVSSFVNGTWVGTGVITHQAPTLNLNGATNVSGPLSALSTFGANGNPPSPKITLPPPATNLATTQALANALRALVITFGFGQ